MCTAKDNAVRPFPSAVRPWLSFASHFPGRFACRRAPCPSPTTEPATRTSSPSRTARSARSIELPIQDGTIRAVDLRQIKVTDDDAGLATYDPGFLNTAACRSAISYIDGDKGILRYRGYPIEQLAERSTFLETAYLLLHGELPSAAELD